VSATPENFPNRMPLTPGIVRKATDAEAAELRKLGWRDGDPVPGGLPELLASLATERARDDARDYDREVAELAGKPPVALRDDQVVSIDSLSEEKKAELRQIFRDVQRIGDAIPSPASDVPGLAQAVAAVGAPPAPEPATEADASTGLGDRKFCPRCRWDLANADVVEATDADKIAYLCSIHGARFRKAVSLFGGNVEVVFRWLTPAEFLLAFDQANRDLEGKPGGQAEYFNAVFSYRLSMSLESIRYPDGKVYPLPVAADLPQPPQGSRDTALAGHLKDLQSRVIVNESLWRVIGDEFARFQRLVERLEAAAGQPDFWPEIPAGR